MMSTRAEEAAFDEAVHTDGGADVKKLPVIQVHAIDASLRGALHTAVCRVQRSKTCLSSEHSAGMLSLRGPEGKRVGLQVFVRVARYSDELPAADPVTGGLLENQK